MFDPKDIILYESGSGGDISVLEGDISTAQQLFLQVYLALFGGNIEADTTGHEQIGEFRSDYWGNSLFFGQNRQKQFNSQTERTLIQTALNSSGRITIRQAVEADLAYLSDVATVTADVIINSINQVTIIVKLTKPNNQTNQVNFVWDKAKQEVITELKI